MPDNVFGNAVSGATTGASLGSIVPGVGTLIGGGIGLLAGLGKGLLGKKQLGLAGKINPNIPNYVTSPYAQQSLGLATQMLNARMPGAVEAGRNIQGAQANQIGNIQRNATDSSTALALGQAAEGQAGQSANDLAIKEGQYKTGILDNVQNAYNQLTGEHQKEYNSQLYKYGIDTQAKTDLTKAGIGNEYGAASDISSLLALLDQSGAFGGKKKPLNIGMGSGLGKTGGLSVTGYNPNFN